MHLCIARKSVRITEVILYTSLVWTWYETWLERGRCLLYVYVYPRSWRCQHLVRSVVVLLGTVLTADRLQQRCFRGRAMAVVPFWVSSFVRIGISERFRAGVHELSNEIQLMNSCRWRGNRWLSYLYTPQCSGVNFNHFRSPLLAVLRVCASWIPSKIVAVRNRLGLVQARLWMPRNTNSMSR